MLRSDNNQGVDLFKRALSTVLVVSIVFYVLSYAWNGKTSILMTVGQAIEPVTHLFGLTWQAFMAFLFAVSFNMPCVMAMSTTYKENHSKKWIAIMIAGIIYQTNNKGA